MPTFWELKGNRSQWFLNLRDKLLLNLSLPLGFDLNWTWLKPLFFPVSQSLKCPSAGWASVPELYLQTLPGSLLLATCPCFHRGTLSPKQCQQLWCQFACFFLVPFSGFYVSVHVLLLKLVATFYLQWSPHMFFLFPSFRYF